MEVSHPSTQRQTFDGQYLWIYTEANNQVVKKLLDPDFLHHPLITLLATMENLEKDFLIKVSTPEDCSTHSLNLTLKDEYSEIREILLVIDKKKLQLKELTLYYETGNYTRLVLDKTKENKKISPECFQFIPPPGVEVVEPAIPKNTR